MRPHAVLAVGFAAVFYGEDKDGIAEIVEAYAVVADAEAELWRLNVLEVLDIAYAGGEITSHDMQFLRRVGGRLIAPWALPNLPFAERWLSSNSRVQQRQRTSRRGRAGRN